MSGTTVIGLAAVGRICPSGPMMRRTSAAVNVVAFISRSKVTSSADTGESKTTLLAVIGWPGTLVEMTCGPGMISGSVPVA